MSETFWTPASKCFKHPPVLHTGDAGVQKPFTDVTDNLWSQCLMKYLPLAWRNILLRAILDRNWFKPSQNTMFLFGTGIGFVLITDAIASRMRGLMSFLVGIWSNMFIVVRAAITVLDYASDFMIRMRFQPVWESVWSCLVEYDKICL